MNKLRLVVCGTLSCFLCSLFDEVFVVTRPSQCSVETVAGLLLVALRTGFHLLCHLVPLIRIKAYVADLSGEEAGRFRLFALRAFLVVFLRQFLPKVLARTRPTQFPKEVTDSAVNRPAW
jgi:hypothetical protein